MSKEKRIATICYGDGETQTPIEIDVDEHWDGVPAGGRHSRGLGYAKDAEKYLEAVLAGWTVIRLTEKQLDLDFIERIVAWINTPRGA